MQPKTNPIQLSNTTHKMQLIHEVDQIQEEQGSSGGNPLSGPA